MRVYFTTDDIPRFRNPVVTVGSFDGVHIGHRALLERARQAAERIGGESVVVTFLPHPRQVIDRNRNRGAEQERLRQREAEQERLRQREQERKPEQMRRWELLPSQEQKWESEQMRRRELLPPQEQKWERDDIKLLNTLAEKAYLLREAGIDNMVVVPFDLSVAGLAADEFVRDILVRKIGMKHFVVGFDHRFGCDRRGGAPYLSALGNELGFTVEEVARQEVSGVGADEESGSEAGGASGYVADAESDAIAGKDICSVGGGDYNSAADEESGSEKVSSTLVRRLISAGDMEAASKLLGRDYIINGIRRGDEVIVEEKDKLLPPAGVYEVAFYETARDVRKTSASGESHANDSDYDANCAPRREGLLTIDGEGRLYLGAAEPQAAGKQTANSEASESAAGDGNEALIEIKKRIQKSDGTGL